MLRKIRYWRQRLIGSPKRQRLVNRWRFFIKPDLKRKIRACLRSLRIY